MTGEECGRRPSPSTRSTAARGPREREALDVIEERPGITIAELADALDVSMNRAW